MNSNLTYCTSTLNSKSQAFKFLERFLFLREQKWVPCAFRQSSSSSRPIIPSQLQRPTSAAVSLNSSSSNQQSLTNSSLFLRSLRIMYLQQFVKLQTTSLTNEANYDGLYDACFQQNTSAIILVVLSGFYCTL